MNSDNDADKQNPTNSLNLENAKIKEITSTPF